MSFGITPVGPYPPATDKDFPTFMQFQSGGVNLGDPTVTTVNFDGGLVATRGVGADSDTITVTVPGLEFDIDSWLTPEQIADTRNPNGPTIDLTDVFTMVHDELLAKYVSRPNPAVKSAGMALYLRVHGSYLVKQLQGSEGGWHPSIFLEGDNYRETIFKQAPGATNHMILGLARNGKTAGSRSNYPLFRNFSIQMTPTVFAADGTGLCGMYFETSRNDPYFDNSASEYNGPILEYIDITGASGDGVYVAQSRHAPKIRFCYFSGNGTNLDVNGDYGDGIYIGSNADAEILQCGSGGNGGHSVHINACETPQIRGGDYWASRNAAKTAGAYRAIYLENMDYAVVDGPDVNGVLEYNGNGKVKSSQIRLIGINFRFRESSFGDGDSDQPGDQPSPQDGYIWIKDGLNVQSLGCSFTPWYNKDGYVQARPDYIYYLTGTTLLHAADRLPEVVSNDWPGGADVVYTPTMVGTITNAWSKINLATPTSDSAIGKNYQMFRFIRFLPDPTGTVGSGIIGRIDGTAPAAGTVGEHLTTKIGSGAPVALTDNVVATLVSVTLTPGEWDLRASAQFSGNAATGTSMKACMTTLASGIDATDSATYAGNAFPFNAVTDDLWSARMGPARISVTANTTYNLNVRARFSAGALGAYGRISARRVG